MSDRRPEGVDDVWPFPSERYLHEWAPNVQLAQNAWLASIDSLHARRTARPTS